MMDDMDTYAPKRTSSHATARMHFYMHTRALCHIPTNVYNISHVLFPTDSQERKHCFTDKYYAVFCNYLINSLENLSK